MNRRVAVRGIIFRDGELLVQLPQDPRNSEAENYWCVNGGGLEIGESLADGLRRELIEEIGVEPVIGRLLYIQQFNGRKSEGMEYFFEIKNVEDYAEFDFLATTHGAIETIKNEFRRPDSIALMPKFLRERDIARDLREMTPVAIYNYL